MIIYLTDMLLMTNQVFSSKFAQSIELKIHFYIDLANDTLNLAVFTQMCELASSHRETAIQAKQIDQPLYIYFCLSNDLFSLASLIYLYQYIFRPYYFTLLSSCQLFYYKLTLYLKMLDKFTHSFSQLKNSISLKYIDVGLRQRSDEILNLMRQCMPEAETCRNYINKIEEVHESFLQSISAFIDSFPHYVAEHQQNYQAMQHQLALTTKIYDEERKEWQLNMQQMNEKLERSNKEIMTKEEEIRWFYLKLQERQNLIEQMERESNDYLKKVQAELQRQQKALQQSCFVVARLQEQVESLKAQNEKLMEAKQPNPINITNQYIVDNSELQINKSVSNSSSPRSFVRCSIEANSEHGLSQFQEVQHSNSREILESIDCNIQFPPRGQTLKEMLNMSVEKQYKLQYNKFDSIEYKLSKENYKFQLRDDLAKDNNEAWGVNNSLQFISKDSQRMQVREFNLPAKEDGRRNNPYYFYFLIASQNAKINSQHFQEICTLSTHSQWQWLNTSKTPLHQWEAHLRSYLLKEAKIL